MVMMIWWWHNMSQCSGLYISFVVSWLILVLHIFVQSHSWIRYKLNYVCESIIGSLRTLYMCNTVSTYMSYVTTSIVKNRLVQWLFTLTATPWNSYYQIVWNCSVCKYFEAAVPLVIMNYLSCKLWVLLVTVRPVKPHHYLMNMNN